MKPTRARFGRLFDGPSKAIGTLGVAFLVDEPRRLPFSVLRVTMRPGAEHEELHHERTAEFFTILRGSVRALIDGRRRLMRRGDFAVLRPGCRHAFHAGARGVEVLAVFSPPLERVHPDIVVDRP